jgi:glycosyltransferase involved in cell wall biosynthesis
MTSAAHPLRVAAFTGSRTVSSRRFRVEQYLAPLALQGVQVNEFVARFGSWPPPQPWLRPAWLAATLADRVVPTLASRRYDLTLLQREFVSTLYTLERFTGRPRVLDIDDAVWLNGDRARRHVAALAQGCDAVVCGNDYIANAVQAWNQRTVVIPTAVDTDRFQAKSTVDEGQRTARLVIGWSGLHSGAKYLLSVEDAVARVFEARRDAELLVVSDVRPSFRLIPQDRVRFVRWTPDNEVSTIQSMDIGLMPIDQSEWSKGKCSYKMLLYMSCGVPVVVTPFGMNVDVLAQGQAMAPGVGVGFGPRDEAQWVEQLLHVLDDPAGRQAMGLVGRQVIEAHYSLRALAPKLAQFLRDVKRDGG